MNKASLTFDATRLSKIVYKKSGEIVHLNTGISADREMLKKFIGGSRVIFVGETHDDTSSHKVELEVIKMLKETGTEFAVGMEMFKRPYQSVLDKWVRGELAEKEFIKDVHWYEEWNMDFNFYSDILNYTRENKISVIALNVADELRMKFRDKGREGLSEGEKKEIPNIDYDDNLHKRLIENIFMEHKKHLPNKDIEKFYRIQCLWEEYMAESVARYLSSDEGKNKKMVVLCGSRHIVFDFGIPKRVLRRINEPFVTIHPLTREEASSPVVSPFIADGIQLLPADFVWIIDRKPLPPKPRMGILMEKKDKDAHVVVSGVVKESPAWKAGLRKGDILLRINGDDISDVFDAVYFVGKKKVGDTVEVEIERNGKAAVFGVTLAVGVFDKHARKR